MSVSNPQPQPPDPNQNIDETKNTPENESVNVLVQTAKNGDNPIIPPDQNIEQQIENLLEQYYRKSVNVWHSGDTSEERKPAKIKLKTEYREAILALVSEAREKTLIQVDPYIDYEFRIQFEELKQTPPTPNGDEQGGLERPRDEK